jgi:flagellar biosynthesis GTPase FlhF
MALRAKKPEAVEKRLKLFMYGPAGVGKTTAAIQFPNAYIIDCEKGTRELRQAD